ncbi:MAG: M14 family metallocarboxypeptidase [Verrucomicrobiota bacterium]
MSSERQFMREQRSHDYDDLLKRWKAVGDGAGLMWEEFDELDGYPLVCVSGGDASEESIYLSAGIHGDESGAVEGLIRWGEANVELLRRLPIVIMPCLNPWGLENNSRRDGRGRDLNRLFDRPRMRPVSSWRRVYGRRRYSVGLCLHEDYDASGIYVYELAQDTEADAGDRLLGACEGILPRQAGDDLDGVPMREGVMRRPERFDEVIREIEGMPEAIYLYLNGTRAALTFETPSEYSLYDRVRAQERAIGEAMVMAREM